MTDIASRSPNGISSTDYVPRLHVAQGLLLLALPIAAMLCMRQMHIWQARAMRAYETPESFNVFFWLCQGFFLGSVLFRKPLARFILYWRRLAPLPWIVFIVGCIAVPSVFQTTLFRRVAFAWWTAPLLVVFLPAIWQWAREQSTEGRLTAGLISITLVITVIPGVHAPPFYDGISGWIYQEDPDEKTVLFGLKLVRDDGAEIWYANGIVNPSNFLWRQLAFLYQDPARMKPVCAYYMAAYTRQYPLLRRGRYPNQRFLGPLGHPGHSPYNAQPYNEFPPERVRYLLYVDEFYVDGVEVSEERRVRFAYNVHTGEYLYLR